VITTCALQPHLQPCLRHSTSPQEEELAAWPSTATPPAPLEFLLVWRRRANRDDQQAEFGVPAQLLASNVSSTL
jgi:hypothetical protein